MPKSKEPWLRFREKFTWWMAHRRETDAGLANYLSGLNRPGSEDESLTANTVKAWRSSSTPADDLLLPITRHLRMSDDPSGDEADPLYLLREMGILDASVGKSREPWLRFREEFTWWMAHRRETEAGLAKHLSRLARPGSEAKGLTRQTVQAWRSWSTPAEDLLVPITRHLRMSDDPRSDEADPLYLLRKMKILDLETSSDEAVRLAFRIEKLRTKMEEQTRLAHRAGRTEGAAQVVRAALDGGLFAVAVHPAIEGPAPAGQDLPEAYRMHVVDRIDIRRADGSDTTRNDVWGDRALNTALRAYGAIEVRQDLPGATRWNPTSDGRVSSWSIAHVGSPSSAMLPFAHPGLHSIVVSSTSIDAWPHDIASLLSMLLGYGYSSVRDLACEIYGKPSSSSSERNLVHESMLYRRVPSRRVWSISSDKVETHWPLFPFRDQAGMVDPDVMHFRLIETPELLAYDERLRKDSDAERMTVARDAGMEAMKAVNSDRIHPIPVGLPPGADHGRGPMWDRTLIVLSQILRHLDDISLLPDLKIVHDKVAIQEPSIAPAVLAWLADRGVPGVEPKWASDQAQGPSRCGAPGHVVEQRRERGSQG